MTASESILIALQHAEGTICDDCMVTAAYLSRRQVSNQICRKMAAHGLIHRGLGKCYLCGKVQLVNSLFPIEQQSNSPMAVSSASPKESTTLISGVEPMPHDRHWYWEGNIQSHIVTWLVGQGYDIRSVANTATREHGKDIIAIGPDRKELWVIVKGFPEKSKYAQARHWFSQAILDALLYHDENADVYIAVAFPEFTTYRKLAKRMDWSRTTLPLMIYWVTEQGQVTAE